MTQIPQSERKNHWGMLRIMPVSLFYSFSKEHKIIDKRMVVNNLPFYLFLFFYISVYSILWRLYLFDGQKMDRKSWYRLALDCFTYFIISYRQQSKIWMSWRGGEVLPFKWLSVYVGFEAIFNIWVSIFYIDKNPMEIRNTISIKQKQKHLLSPCAFQNERIQGFV